VRLTFKLEQDQLWIGTKDSRREPNMPNSPGSGQHCRYSVFEVNAKEKYRGSQHMRLTGFRDRPFGMTPL